MEFKITKQNFSEALAKTQGVVERKNTMPVLSNILLDADKNGLKVSATDLEVSILCHVPASIITPGKITIQARNLYDIVREINQPEIRVVLNENDRIEIIAGSSRFNIPGLNASEFPKLPEIKVDSLELPCELFLEMIQKTAYGMSTDDTRQNLAGILLEGESDKIKMVATDGHRLALCEEKIQATLGNVKLIIPRKGVLELKKMVSSEGSFELALGDKNLLARKGNETLFIRLIDGDFPDYNRVIPPNPTREVRLSRETFIGALRRVSLLSNERSRGVMLHFTPGHLEVSISNPDLGEAKEEFEIDYKDEKMSIGFNARFFLDALEIIKKDIIRLKLSSDQAPCIIQVEGDPGYLGVIMPMRI